MKAQAGNRSTPPAAANPLKVLLVDDHEPTLTAIAAILEGEYPRIVVVGAANNGEKALRLSRETTPDVVVLDIHLGASYGLDLMPSVCTAGSAVVVFSYSDNRAEREHALALGASAFISKLRPAQELVDAILAAPRNGAVLEGGLS